MPEELGIENLKSAYKVAAALRNTTAEALADGFQWQDAFKFVPVLLQAQDVIKNAKQIAAEAMDLSHTERDELERYAIDELKIANADVEEFIADATDWIAATIIMIGSGKKVFTKPTTPTP